MPRISNVVVASFAAFFSSSDPAAVAFRVRQRRRKAKLSDVSAASVAQAASSPGKVITLGDSYSSGTGIHKSAKDYEGGDCWQDRKTTPGARYAQNDGLEVINVACKGDEVPGIKQQFAALAASNPADATNGFNGSTILFTIGGNDLRTNKGESWPSLLKSCIMSFYGKCHEKRENQIANFAELQATVTDLYTQVARDAPKARIRILGYPRLMQRSFLCVPVPGLASKAADWADDQVDELNRRLSMAVATVKALSPEGLDIEFVDVKSYFKKGACKTLKREINAIVLSGLSISDASFHPSQRGYNKYYDALGNSLGRSLPPLQPPPEVRDPDSLMHVFRGWDKSGSGFIDMHEALAMAGEDATPDVTKRIRRLFMEADQDQDDALSLEEFETFMELVEDE